jgi:hypothetical protein
MKLSAEQFRELASSFGDGEPTQEKRERRRAARLELNAKLTITPVIGGRRRAPLSVSVADFSVRGFSFLHSAEMAPGSQFVTELPRKSGGTAHLLCTIRRSEPANGLGFRIGAEFTRSLPPAHAWDDLAQIDAEDAGDAGDQQSIRS